MHYFFFFFEGKNMHYLILLFDKNEKERQLFSPFS